MDRGISMHHTSLDYQGRQITATSLQEWAKDHFGSLPVVHRNGLPGWDCLHSLLLTAMPFTLIADSRSHTFFDVLVGQFICDGGGENCTLRLAPRNSNPFAFSLKEGVEASICNFSLGSFAEPMIVIEIIDSICLEIFLRQPCLDTLTAPINPPRTWFKVCKGNTKRI